MFSKLLLFFAILCSIHSLQSSTAMLSDSAFLAPGLLSLSQACSIEISFSIYCDVEGCATKTDPTGYSGVVTSTEGNTIYITLTDTDSSNDDCPETYSASVSCDTPDDDDVCIIGNGEYAVVVIAMDDGGETVVIEDIPIE